jgi:HNH endonuclease
MSTPTAIFTKQSHVTGYVLRAAIREQVLTRAGWRCQACGLRRRLDVHHVAKRAQGGSDFDLNLLVALCRWCHDQTDAPYERGAARGDPVGRRSVYVRGRRAGGTWHSPGRGCSICPRGQKLSPSTITVARPRWGRCAHLGKPRPLLSRETRQQNVLLAEIGPAIEIRDGSPTQQARLFRDLARPGFEDLVTATRTGDGGTDALRLHLPLRRTSSRGADQG